MADEREVAQDGVLALHHVVDAEQDDRAHERERPPGGGPALGREDDGGEDDERSQDEDPSHHGASLRGTATDRERHRHGPHMAYPGGRTHVGSVPMTWRAQATDRTPRVCTRRVLRAHQYWARP